MSRSWDDTLSDDRNFSLGQYGRIRIGRTTGTRPSISFCCDYEHLQDPVSGLGTFMAGPFLERKPPARKPSLGRGNCWITPAIPELFTHSLSPEPVARIYRRPQNACGGAPVSVGQRNKNTAADILNREEVKSATCGFLLYELAAACHRGSGGRGNESSAHPDIEEGVLGMYPRNTYGKENRISNKEKLRRAHVLLDRALLFIPK